MGCGASGSRPGAAYNLPEEDAPAGGGVLADQELAGKDNALSAHRAGKPAREAGRAPARRPAQDAWSAKENQDPEFGAARPSYRRGGASAATRPRNAPRLAAGDGRQPVLVRGVDERGRVAGTRKASNPGTKTPWVVAEERTRAKKPGHEEADDRVLPFRAGGASGAEDEASDDELFGASVSARGRPAPSAPYELVYEKGRPRATAAPRAAPRSSADRGPQWATRTGAGVFDSPPRGYTNAEGVEWSVPPAAVVQAAGVEWSVPVPPRRAEKEKVVRAAGVEWSVPPRRANGSESTGVEWSVPPEEVVRAAGVEWSVPPRRAEKEKVVRAAGVEWSVPPRRTDLGAGTERPTRDGATITTRRAQDPRGAKTASWMSDSDELQKRMNKKFGTQSARAVGARSAGRPTRGPDSLTGRAMALLEQRPAFESTNNLVFRRKTAALARAKTP